MGVLFLSPQLGLDTNCGSAVREMCVNLGKLLSFLSYVSSFINEVLIVSTLQCYCKI